MDATGTGHGPQQPDIRQRVGAALFRAIGPLVRFVQVDGLRGSDMWGWLTALATSLPYDAALYDPGFGPPRDRLATIAVPTLAVAGGNTFESLRAATRAVAEAIPWARYVELEGEDHGILQRPAALASLIVDFLS